MLDATPAPYGDLTRRWNRIPTAARAARARPLIVGACESPAVEHVDDPGLDDGACYWQLVSSAHAGNELAWGWLAATHCPTLLRHGRWLMEDDPGEWGVVAFDVFVRAIGVADLRTGRWLRRRLAGRLVREMSAVRRRLQRRSSFEMSIDPSVLSRFERPVVGSGSELAEVIDLAIMEFDQPTRDALLEIAHGGCVRDVARDHGLPYMTLHQRVWRARERLRPQLAGFVRAAAS
jgi:DNA-directed RNA polymerase specialized sigma24 family protein